MTLSSSGTVRCLPFGVVLLLSSLLHAQSSNLAQCGPAGLDVRFLSGFESLHVRVVAVEFKNRADNPCYLGGFVLKFPPEEASQNGFPWAVDQSEAAKQFQQNSQRLDPGETAHRVIAWSTRPIPADGLELNNCTIRDTLTLSRDAPGERSTFLEVKHLGMRVCDEFWLSAYRRGPYVAGEAISPDWLKRFQVDPADTVAGNETADYSSNGPGLEPPQLRTLSEVEYLPSKDLYSGYFGYFELILKTAAPPDCGFVSAHKREADGTTTVYLNQCDYHQPPPVHALPAREIRLPVRDLGLRPVRPGRVEYTVMTRVAIGKKWAFVPASTVVSVRDPELPLLPVIDSSVPACTGSQLRLSGPPVDLGEHWATPALYAPKGEAWHDGKIYEVKNVSQIACMVGGVPTLKFLSPPDTGTLSVGYCRNCATPVLRPRESRWIELHPGESAHFGVVRAVFGADHSSFCTLTIGINLFLPGEKDPMQLSFEAGICRVTVSAWRAGKYDADPLNVKYDQRERERFQKQVGKDPLPKECEKEITADTGRPVMFFTANPISWGLSTRPVPVGEPDPVLLWLFNSTDHPRSVMTCSDIDWFWGALDVFDSQGRRVLGPEEQKRRRSAGKIEGITGGIEGLWVCSRNFGIEIPAHACMHTTFTNAAYDFARDIRRYYQLSPGQYVLLPGMTNPTKGESRLSRAPESPKGAALVVLEQ